MENKMQKINEIVSSCTEQEILQALIVKMGFDLDKVKGKDVLDKAINSYTTKNTFNKLDKFKGKKALVGDYFRPSYANTKEVLESLGFEVINEETEPRYV